MVDSHRRSEVWKRFAAEVTNKSHKLVLRQSLFGFLARTDKCTITYKNSKYFLTLLGIIVHLLVTRDVSYFFVCLFWLDHPKSTKVGRNLNKVQNANLWRTSEFSCIFVLLFSLPPFLLLSPFICPIRTIQWVVTYPVYVPPTLELFKSNFIAAFCFSSSFSLLNQCFIIYWLKLARS